MAAAGTEQQLAWEAAQRKRAAVAAAIAALFLLGAQIWIGLAFADRPVPDFLESLARLPAPGPIAEQESLRVPTFEYLRQHEEVGIATAALRTIGLVALAWALTFLAAATRARRPEMARPFVYVSLFGALLVAVATVMRAAGDIHALNVFPDGPRTVADVESLGSSVVVSAAILQYLGLFALGVGFVVVSMNAMRVGLLTRFVGYVGMIVGFLLVVRPETVPPLQAMWLLALAVLFAGRWPRGEPPAWRTGQAEPWPGRQRLAPAAAPAEPPAAGPATAAALPSSRKRKRKRRS